MDNNQLANVFYGLAVALQQGDKTAPLGALVHVQRQIEKILPPAESAKFHSGCGFLYW